MSSEGNVLGYGNTNGYGNDNDNGFNHQGHEGSRTAHQDFLLRGPSWAWLKQLIFNNLKIPQLFCQAVVFF